MKKILTGSLAALSITGGSVAIAALNPFGAATAQTDGGSTTTAPDSSDASDTSERHGFLADALQSLVDNGTLTQAQADAVEARVAATAPAPHLRIGGVDLDDVASFLGISVDDLRTRLQNDETLAAIAGDRTDALIQQLVDAANARIDEAVAAGKLTEDNAAELKTNTAERITAIVNGEAPLGGHGRHSGPRGFGG